jgi:hypothetical protein
MQIAPDTVNEAERLKQAPVAISGIAAKRVDRDTERGHQQMLTVA